ncbi:MAG: N-glycosylase/DNA lyase [Candidatus Hermodarchaeota archaeon]
MQELIDKLLSLQESEIKSRIDARLTEFFEIRNHDIETIFKELCFCIMTANCSALKCIEIHESIGDAFLTYSEEELIDKFKDLGYRFPNVRSRFIIEARNKIDQLKQAIESGNDGNTLREWIVKNIKGIGYKEASHFLRNIGFNDYAIIDFHIIDVLETYNIIQKPKTLTKRKYLEIEEILKELGKKLELNLAELDLFLWFLETGKILK